MVYSNHIKYYHIQFTICMDLHLKMAKMASLASLIRTLHGIDCQLLRASLTSGQPGLISRVWLLSVLKNPQAVQEWGITPPAPPQKK